MTRDQLVEIFNDTLESIKVGGYENKLGEWIELDQGRLETGTQFYVRLPASKNEDLPKYSTRIYVEVKDTYQKAREMGPDAAVLNMASYICPGGGVRNGSRAQEEELCRRSNLYLGLAKYHPNYCDLLGISPSENNHYPIPLYGGIYCPQVSVWKSAQSYNPLEEPFYTNVISVPGIKRPDIDLKTGDMVPKAELIMLGKIRSIFRIALLNGHTRLVLGALGCGAYGCPASHVARLFKKVLEEKEFANHFQEICFAILEDQNSPRGGNVRPFKEVFND